jgi:hypothetical protein
MIDRTPDAQPPPVPVKYARKWIAWSSDHMEILAAADRLQDLWKEVEQRGIEGPIFERVPRANARFIG